VTLPVAVLLILLAWPAVSHAACEDWVATIVSVQGTSEKRPPGEVRWVGAAMGDLLCPGDSVRVHDKSRIAVRLRNDAILRLDQNSTITFRTVKDEPATWIDLVRGIVHFISRVPRGIRIATPFVNGTVEGTEFVFDVDSDRAVATTLAGTLALETPDGQRHAAAGGQSVVARPGQKLAFQPIAPRDAVQWALYYPSILAVRTSDFPDVPGQTWPGQVRASVEAYQKNDVGAALAALEQVPATIAEPAVLLYRAVVLLSVGRVAEARQAIGRLPETDGRRKAVESVIAVVLGDKTLALARGDEAVRALPGSAAPWIALSYARQASFDLPGAHDSVVQAIRVEPRNALAHARLAELSLSLGRVPDALRAAEEAVRLDPNLARTQTVLGFAHLAEFNTRLAQEAFERAIALDPSDPLARLGRGLARIRQGHVEEGRRELETAASLDPGNSVVRSYLGKAYYEERRSKPASEEYARAKELDPKDPTAWFYGAIEKQTTNRPVEALQDMQRAIELNDNRAVYRSSLQLDADLAARSAALARIYGDLGFQQLALVEGWKSVNTDPTNFSAHRFLADSYAILPRHEIARVSELLQSQLLQPLNITPIQPRLAESNLFLIGALGPAALGFNEFNPLFTRDGLTFQASGLGGSHDTYAGEGVLSGIFGRASFSLGGFHYETDGWRTNAGQKDTIANAFFQFSPTPRTSVQAEFRYRKTKEGDLQLNFFTDDLREHFTQEVETTSYRLGLRHAFAPHSTVLASFIYQHRDSSQVDRPNEIFVGLSDRFPRQEAFSGELQYLFRSPQLSVTSGVGHFSVDKRHDVRLDFDFTAIGGGPVTVRTVTEEDDHHTNAYAYAYLNLLRTLTVTLGLSGDVFETQSKDTESRSQANPKLGVTWNPFPDTTLRAAAFRVLKRTLITDQTLEPTQVAGFNQFFDDINSTDSWRYGVAVDQKFSHSLFAGAEWSARRLSVPFRSTVVDEFGEVVEDRVRRGDAREYLGRAYLFWTPHPWVALSAEYQRERFENDSAVAFFFKEVTTHRVPLAVRFFHPSGFAALLKGTYVNQHGDFVRRGAGTVESGKDDFFLLDAGISYRFPKRYGIASIGVTNLTDQRFRYQETDFRNASIIPSRTILGRLTFELP
jgi:tetratricopeptide (TPR) repeat protein